MSRAAPWAALALGLGAAAIAMNGGLDVSWAIGALRLGILLNTASSLALVTLAGAALLAQRAGHPAGAGAILLGGLAATAPSPAQLVLAASLGAGAHPAVVAGLGAAAALGGAPDQLRGLGAEHALGVVVTILSLGSARGPLAPILVLLTASALSPALWASGWGRVALISGGVGASALAALGAVLDRSRASARLGWAWVGLGLAALGVAGAPLGLTVGLAGLAVAAQVGGGGVAEPSPRRWPLTLLAAGVAPHLGVGGGRDPLLALVLSGDPLAAAGILAVCAATGACLGRADAGRVLPAVVSVLAAPTLLGLSRAIGGAAALPGPALDLGGLLAGGITLAAWGYAARGGRLPERATPAPRPSRPWPLLLAPPRVSAERVTRAVVAVTLALWALWAVSAGVPGLGLEPPWAR